MNVSFELNADGCSNVLNDPKRLAALEESKLMGSGSDEAFDRLTYLASKLLNVPLTIVSFVGDKKQYFKSFHGLPEPWSTEREIPIDVSVCQYTLTGNILSLSDAREHPLLASNPALSSLNLVGYLGVPLLDENGNNLGAFCAISNERRDWSESDIETLKYLTLSIMSEIKLVSKVEQLKKEQEDLETAVALLSHDIRSPIATAYSFSEAAILSKDPEITDQALQSIRRTTGESLKLVDQMLNWKNDKLSGKNNRLFEHFSLMPDFQEFIDDCERSEGVKIDVESSDPEIKIFGNQQSLMRAVRNLVSNAIKYGDRQKKISVKFTSTPELCRFDVHNYGAPIPEENLEEIFKLGKRVSGLSNDQSWGFGLAQVSAAATSHYGKVSVTSSQDSGTNFSLIIPNKM